MDREYLCPSKTATTCFVKLDVIIESPLRIFNIELEIKDINDNAPHFRRDRVELDVSESATPGERFSLPNAVDPDGGINTVKMYKLSESEHFTIEIQTGSDGTKYVDMVLTKALDREEHAVHHLILTAVDGGVPARSDMNDNYPDITVKSYKSTVNENIPVGTVIAIVGISDRDTGDNGKVSLSINQNLPFVLNKSSDVLYELKVSEPLDRERVPEYDITLVVTDGGTPPLSDNETITLHLLDVNDNGPLFPQSFYTIPVIENNAPGALLSSLTAFDPDLHENQYLVYFIIEKEIVNTSMSMLFSINPENGNLYALKTFDYEIEKEFLFHIEARDSGVPPLSSNVTVHIIIVDQNDNTPVITAVKAYSDMTEVPLEYDIFSDLNLYLVIGLGSVSFFAPPSRNSVISERNSTIADSTLVSNDAYWYSLFLAETRKGKLVVRQPVPKAGSRYIVSSLPRSTGLTETSDSAASTLQAVHNLILTAEDGGVPARSGTASIVVRVLDTNDNAPKFDKDNYKIDIMENSPIGSLVVKLNATDLDEGTNSEILYSYSLYTSEKTQQTFHLNPNNGEITVKEMVNYEDFRIYDMEVIATDKGSNSLTVKEDIAVDTVIAVVSVSDKDSVPLEYDIFSDLNLYLVIGLGSVSFLLLITILVTCVLKCQKPIPSKAAPPSRNSVISERNSTIVDSTLVSNDAYWYSLFLAETRKGKLVVRQPVPKAGSRYIVSSLPRSTGLTETSDSAASTLQAVHNLILTAVDGGVPTRSGTASITVRVLDTNDNAPKFDKDNYKIDIMENSPIGSLVVKLNATDLDEGTNSEILYSYSLYTSEKTQQTFHLNPNNGEITVKEMINYEDFRIYDMEVIATDKGPNSLTGQCKLTILVTDMNDNHPEISIKSFQSPVKEVIAVDTVIAVVSVSDKDSGDNGIVDIRIADKLPFALRESSDNYYELVVSQPLDREKVPEYEITFTVKDRGSPPLSDNETMTLELLDVNDNVPHRSTLFPLWR
ncbi:unnamed protein product, partial [Oncorhynchus mykiss]